MKYWIRTQIGKFRWKRQGKPMIKYSGFNCGCCGAWHDIPFEVPTYLSAGKWWDTWDLCPNGCAKHARKTYNRKAGEA